MPKGLTKYLTMLHEELSSHMMKEEQILFPMIKQGMGSRAMGPISVMESEHDEAGELLEVIKHTTNNVTPPPEACTTRKAMYNGINELIDDLMEHISLENNVLFRARWRVSDLKAGWHCAIQHDNRLFPQFSSPLLTNKQPAQPQRDKPQRVTSSARRVSSSSVNNTRTTNTKNAIHTQHISLPSGIL